MKLFVRLSCFCLTCLLFSCEKGLKEEKDLPDMELVLIDSLVFNVLKRKSCIKRFGHLAILHCLRSATVARTYPQDG